MNRRSFLKGLLGGAAVLSLPIVAERQQISRVEAAPLLKEASYTSGCMMHAGTGDRRPVHFIRGDQLDPEALKAYVKRSYREWLDSEVRKSWRGVL